MIEPRPWLALYPSNVPDALPVPNTNALAQFASQASERPESPCIQYLGSEFSFAEIDSESDSFACGLAHSGFGVGDRCGLYIQNIPQFLIAVLGTWKAGGIAVPISPMLRQRELAFELEDSACRVLVCDSDLYDEVVRPVLASSSVIVTLVTNGHDYEFGIPSRSEEPLPAGAHSFIALVRSHDGSRPAPVDITPESVAYLVYTSGTTGPPKAAMCLHGAVALQGRVLGTWMNLGPQDTILCGAPLFHVTGLIAGVATSHAVGAPMVLFGRFDAGRCLEMIERWHASFTVMAITAFIALLNHPDVHFRDISSLQKAYSGGAPISAATVSAWRRTTGVTIHGIYGLTETTSPSHAVPFGVDAPIDPVSGTLAVGVPLPNVYSWVSDIDTGHALEPGQVGEIAIRGPMVVPGYWNQPEASAATIVNGVLFTGDIGKQDVTGWLFVIDRKKDQINASGYKVWPREVEDVLYEHSGVREAAVLGVADAYRGETVVAYISLRQDAIVSPDEIVKFCRDRLASYKCPREVKILSELPKTPTGKILKRKLRAVDD